MNLLQKVERNHGKHSMKFRFCTRFFVSLILMCGYLGAMAQNIQISGVVKDVVGDPLIGVSVLVKGGTKGTSTDYNGFYTISAPADGTLVFSYGGYGYPRGENRRFEKIRCDYDRKWKLHRRSSRYRLWYGKET